MRSCYGVIGSVALLGMLTACGNSGQPIAFDDALLNANAGRIRTAARDADLVFVGRVSALGAPPPFSSGVVTTFQEVTYEVERILRGVHPDPTITVSYVVVAGSRLADPADTTAALSPTIFAAGNRLIVFAERVNIMAFKGTDQNFGTIPFSGQNQTAVLLTM